MPKTVKTKVTYIISGVHKALAFEWIPKELNKEEIELSFILLNPAPSYLYEFLTKNNIEAYELEYHGKRNVLQVFRKVMSLLKKIKCDIVHTHLVDANLIGLTAAKLLGIKKRIYSRHNSTYHRRYSKKGVWLDKLNIFLSTDILSISKNVTEVLTKFDGAPASKIHLIYHGFDLEKFKNPNKSDVIELAQKFNGSQKRPVVGVISRYMHWKGLQYIIPAFALLLEKHPNALLVVAGSGSGDYSAEIKSLLSELPSGSYIETGFVENLYALYPLFDVFVHTPIDPYLEAFGQIYIESLISGIPSVLTLSGIGREILKDRENCLEVDFCDSHSIVRAINEILSDNELKEKIITGGRQTIDSRFELNTMIMSLEKLYLN